MAVLFAGFFIFKYLEADEKIKTTVQDSFSGANAEEQEQFEEEQPSVNISPQIETEPQSGIFVCADKCGDNICQTSDPGCKNDLNCICLENQRECPQDCK